MLPVELEDDGAEDEDDEDAALKGRVGAPNFIAPCPS